MGFFDDDPFEGIVREFFGKGSGSPFRKGRRETIIRGEEEDRTIDFVEDAEKVYLVFELFGFGEKDLMVGVKGKTLEIIAQKKAEEEIQDYLMEKLGRGVVIRKELPNFINPKGFSYTMRNGLLEVVFSKRK